MDYKKKYEEVLEAIKKLQEANPSDKCISNWVNDNIPELAESKDDRIRKELCKAIWNYIPYEKAHKYIAWLEKQYEQKPIMNIPSREVIFSIWDLGNDWKELTGGCISTEFGTQLEYIQKHWYESEYYLKEKQSKKETICDKCKKEHPSHFCQDITALGRCALEHNIANNGEQKFHEGDWIVDNCGYVWKIERITNRFYTLKGIKEDESQSTIEWIDKTAHLWTINDAKDGDVLASKNGNEILIFRKLDSSTSFSSYYNINKKGEFGWSNRSFIPATKDQCYTLMKAMDDAGYIFDFEKKKLKELKKVEQNPAWNEEDERIRKTSISFLKHYADKGYENAVECIDWLESLKDRVHPQLKQEWSEDDEHIILGIIDEIAVNKSEAPESDYKTYDMFIDWLKSLKEKLKKNIEPKFKMYDYV